MFCQPDSGFCRYRVVSYGTKLLETHDGKDRWTFTFDLQRELDQASFQEALRHPTADELDDWEDYQRAKLTRVDHGMSMLSGSFREADRKVPNLGHFL